MIDEPDKSNSEQSEDEFIPAKKRILKHDQNSSNSKKLSNEYLSAAWDRSKVSNRSASLIVASTLNAAGLDVTKYAFSKETLRRSRSNHRAIMNAIFGKHLVQ